MPDLQGKTMLVTGASRGIGAATASVLAAAGADLVVHYGGNRAGAERACGTLGDDRRLLVGADLSVPGASRVLWREALSWRKRIDVVVVNAAVSRETPIDATDLEWDDAWAEIIQINVLEAASLIREAVRHFLEHGGGTLITLSSWSGQQGSAIPQLSAYSASKAAVKAITQTVARSHARDNILAYAVAPGIVQTRMSEISATYRGGIEELNAALAMGEMVPPDEIGRLVAFLASGACRHLTGATLDVNGATYVR